MKSSRFLIGLIAVVASFVVGRIAGSDDISTIMFLCVGGVWLFVTLSSLSKKNELAQVTEKRQQLADISEKYNLQVKQLADKGNTPDFEQAYERLHTAFDQETGSVLDNEAVKTLRSWRSRYLMIPLLALCALLFNWGGQGREAQIEAEKFAALTATDEWAAETIPMPFLEDSMRYVSNPDKTVSPETENKLNEMLFQLDKGQDIQSAMIIVNHVRNADIDGFAQAVGNQYGVGRNDRGLLLVLAYGDRLFRIHTGRALGADLTDVECGRLEKEYFVPAMKRQMPDSAMLAITEAIKCYLAKKEMPQATFLTADDNTTPPIGTSFVHYLLLFVVWLVSLIFMNKRMKWGNLGKQAFMENPFKETAALAAASTDSHTDRRESKEETPQEEKRGGTYGGGKFDGGGATTSW